jgi:hypothetical protein
MGSKSIIVKSFHSSAVVPVMRGMPAALPPRTAARIEEGSTRPSSTGRKGMPDIAPSPRSLPTSVIAATTIWLWASSSWAVDSAMRASMESTPARAT